MRSTWIWIAVLGLPAAAMAGSVYLNGVNIDGVTGQKFDKVNVRIDEKGNVLIDAPGYAVKAVSSGPGMPGPSGPVQTVPAAVVSKRYWLVTEQTVPGMTEFDIDVYINSKFLRTLRNNEDQIVTEVTKSLQPGQNTVLLVAKKRLSGTNRKSFSADHLFQVIIGEGNVGGDNVMIDTQLLKFKVTAAETEDQSREFTFNTR